MEAHRYLCRALYSADRPPRSAQLGPSSARPVAPAPATARAAQAAPAQSAAEERLRRGRVSVRGEQLINFEKVMRSSLSALTLSSAQQALTQLKVPPDAIPKLPTNMPSVLRVLSEYARRGEEALSHHGILEAE